MVTLVVFHHVRDYDAWKRVFDEHESVRRRHGQREQRIYRGFDDGTRVIVHIDFPDEEAARGFMSEPTLGPTMERAGVTDEPWLGLIVRIEQKRYVQGLAAVTAVVHHRVRDYAEWKSAFDEHEAVRRSHGQLEHRLYHAVGDELQLAIHNDFPTAEAAASFAGDPTLREAMARAGVEGEPGVGMITLAERTPSV